MIPTAVTRYCRASKRVDARFKVLQDKGWNPAEDGVLAARRAEAEHWRKRLPASAREAIAPETTGGGE
jgi:hypothetical protein